MDATEQIPLLHEGKGRRRYHQIQMLEVESDGMARGSGVFHNVDSLMSSAQATRCGIRGGATTACNRERKAFYSEYMQRKIHTKSTFGGDFVLRYVECMPLCQSLS